MIPALDLSTLLAGLVAPAPAGVDAKGDLFANLMGEAPVVVTPDPLPSGTLATAPAILPKLKVGEKAVGDAETEPTAEGEGEEPELPPIIASLLAAETPVVEQPVIAQPVAVVPPPVAPNPAITAESPVQSPTTAAASIMLAPQVARQMPSARMIDDDVSLADPSFPGENRGPDLTPPMDPGLRRGTDSQLSSNPTITAESPVQSPTIAAASIMLAPQVARQMPSARMIDDDVSLADPLLPGESRGPNPTPPLDPGFRRGTDMALPAMARAISPQPGAARADLPGPAVFNEPTPIRPAAAITLADAFLATLLPQAVAATEALQPTDSAPQLDAVAPQLDLAHEHEWLDRLAKDIARTANPDGSLRFRLNPEHLGSLHVEVSRGEAGAAIRLTTETEGARQIIADAQPRLIAEARAQGVKVSETHVDLGQSGQERGASDHQRGEGQHGLAGDPRGNRERGERSSLTGNKPNGPKQDNEAPSHLNGAAAPTSDRFA